MIPDSKNLLFIFTAVFFLISGNLSAQENLNSTFNKKQVSRTSTHKHLKPIYKHPSKNRMYSNECVHDYTSQMGFEYVILTGDCERALGQMSGMEIGFHNFSVGLGLVFKKGPFWKHKVKKRYKFCRERMGDVIE